MLAKNEATSDELDDSDTSGASHKGCSIWSLLVIMTLLAVWMAIPRRITSHAYPVHVFFIGHQIALWLVVGIGLWLVLGKRTLLLVTILAAIVIVWLPIGLSVIETALTGTVGNTKCEQFVRYLGLHGFYTFVYRGLFTGLGYGN